METKITPMEFMKRLREKAERARGKGKYKDIPTKHSELFAKLRERAMLKKTEVAEIEKKEE